MNICYICRLYDKCVQLVPKRIKINRRRTTFVTLRNVGNCLVRRTTFVTIRNVGNCLLAEKQSGRTTLQVHAKPVQICSENMTNVVFYPSIYFQSLVNTANQSISRQPVIVRLVLQVHRILSIDLYNASIPLYIFSGYMSKSSGKIKLILSYQTLSGKKYFFI